jgi:hypothetical protein
MIGDLYWARFYGGTVCKLAIEYYDEGDMPKPIEWYQERRAGCLEIIARIVFEIRRRNEQKIQFKVD